MEIFFNCLQRFLVMSFLNFTDRKSPPSSPLKIKKAFRLIQKWKPNLKVEGEIQADIAVNEELSQELFPHKTFKKGANVLIFPNLDSGNIAYKLVQQLGAGEVLGPLLMGVKKPVNIVQRTCTVEDIINTLILTALKAHAYRERGN